MSFTSSILFTLFISFSFNVVAQLNDTAPFTNATVPTENSTTAFWLEQIKHQGTVAFRQNSTYQVFRNVKDFGAKGLHVYSWVMIFPH